MVSIDTVYQRVLALANKEQRGYITTQEFNLFANQAQMEMFEQYFYDIKQFNRTPGNTQEYSDPLSTLYEKIGLFEMERGNAWINTNMPVVGGMWMTIPSEVYKIGTVRVNAGQVELLNSKDYDEARKSPLTAPTLEKPIGYLSNRGLAISIGDNLPNPIPSNSNLSISYIKRPAKVEWAYVIVNDKALYNDNISVDFELHPSEETELVYKILKYSGVSLKAEDVMQIGQALEMGQNQQEKQ